mgnify:CR=1 FL=1
MASLTFEASLPHPDDTDKLGARLADAVSKEAGAVWPCALRATSVQARRRSFAPCCAASALPAP